MESNYYLLFKTAQAEQRAWKNLSSNYKGKISPIIELTRGRKIPKSEVRKDTENISKDDFSTTPDIYAFNKTVTKTLKDFAVCNEVIIDITREPSLSCYEINSLSNSRDGYEDWYQFLTNQNHENLIPTLIINPNDEEQENAEAYLNSLKTQIDKLYSVFNTIAYRVSILSDEGFIYDFSILKDIIQEYLDAGKEFYVILDHEYISSHSSAIHSERTSDAIKKIENEFTPSKLICVATSYPKNVTELGGQEDGNFPTEETLLYQKISQRVESQIYYGDYGSINPVRNDGTFRSPWGWVPKIEFISKDHTYTTYYIRERRSSIGKNSEGKNILAPYKGHYQSVAIKVINHPKYKALEKSWGCMCIQNTSNGNVSGTSPSFWISVRMEMHIIHMLLMLKLV